MLLLTVFVVEIFTTDFLASAIELLYDRTSHRDTERQYIIELEAAKHKWEEEMQEHRETVDAEQVAEVVAMMSGAPVQRITQTENIRLRDMGALLKEKIIRQDEAVEKIVKAIQRNRVGGTRRRDW